VLAVPLISTLFLYGEFAEHDLWMTRQALIAYSVGLLGLILVKVLAPGFYARQNIRTPVKVGIFTLLATQMMNLAFIWHLKHAGLALAIGLGACMNAAILFRLLVKHGIYTPQPGWGRFFLKVVTALACMCGALFFAAGSSRDWIELGFSMRVLWLAGLVVLGAGVYFLMLWAMGIRPDQFKRRAA
jgi:putative peptidoglycan lipid II flippase